MSRPLTLVMDVTERCNLSCVMCYFSNVDRLRFPPFDRGLSSNGNMPLEIFEQVAERYFSQAWRVSLGCAAEPMIHSKFADILEIAGRYKIKDLWFPTNLLALTEKKAEAIVKAGVSTVAVSMDGTTGDIYEKIRIGGKWPMFVKKLELLNQVRRGSRTGTRLIYTWMKSNRHDLKNLPAFAEKYGVKELDVRYVTPTTGVDNTPELLGDEGREVLDAELASMAEDAVSRGIKLAYFPAFDTPEDLKRNPFTRLKRALWRRKAGLYRAEYFRYEWQKRMDGCAYPKRTYVIRPNGAVSPCIFWDRDPMGFLPEQTADEINLNVDRVRDGLRCGKPEGTCETCSVRRNAFYQPFKVKSTEPAESAEQAPGLG